MIQFSREWAMPNLETFSIKPIEALLQRRLKGALSIVDPFARNSKFGTITNDLDPRTSAKWHMRAEEFIATICGSVDAALVDPPYSPRQMAESYQHAGIPVGQRETQHAGFICEIKDGLAKIIRPGGMAICCGWNSTGFGKNRGFILEEVLIVNHGGSHNDTIVTVERKAEATP